MRKKLALFTAAALVASGIVAAFVLSTSATAATTLTVIEHEVGEHFVDVGKSGLNPGDYFTFHSPIYDSTDTNRVGKDNGSCIRTSNKKGTWECAGTTLLESDATSITLEGAFYDTGKTTQAITGGTGTYEGASGSVDISCKKKECTLKFSLS
jgi:allene oxide cyclase